MRHQKMSGCMLSLGCYLPGELPNVSPFTESVKVILELRGTVSLVNSCKPFGIIDKHISEWFHTSGMPLTQITKRGVPSTLPCGIPLVEGVHGKCVPLMTTLCWRSLRVMDPFPIHSLWFPDVVPLVKAVHEALCRMPSCSLGRCVECTMGFQDVSPWIDNY